MTPSQYCTKLYSICKHWIYTHATMLNVKLSAYEWYVNLRCFCWVLIIGNTQRARRGSWTPGHHGPQRLLRGREGAHKRGCEYNHLLPRGPARTAMHQEIKEKKNCAAHWKTAVNQRGLYLDKVVLSTHNLRRVDFRSENFVLLPRFVLYGGLYLISRQKEWTRRNMGAFICHAWAKPS